MGYRSEVVIKFSEEAAKVVRAARDMCPVLKGLLDDNEAHEANGDPDKVEVLYFSHIKWYENYEEIIAMEQLLDQLYEEDFGFMRVGEDREDIETRGEPWEYDIYLNRSISW